MALPVLPGLLQLIRTDGRSPHKYIPVGVTNELILRALLFGGESGPYPELGQVYGHYHVEEVLAATDQARRICGL